MKPPDTLLTAFVTRRRNAPEHLAALDYHRRYMQAWDERMMHLLERDAAGESLSDIERHWVENRKGRCKPKTPT